MKKSLILSILLLTILITFFSRFYQLSNLPSVLHRDETSIAFNAYSLLKTGHDEHGQSWPISFEAFGDYKLPGLIYLSIPFINFLGLNPLAIRLPNAIFSVFLVYAGYLLATELFKKKSLSVIFAFLIASSPFFISSARNAYEPAIAIFFEIMALFFLLKSRFQVKFFLLFILNSFIASYFYHSAILILPFLSLVIVYIYRQDFFKSQKRIKQSVFLLIVYILSLLINIINISSVNQSRSNTLIFNSPEINDEIQKKTYQLDNSGLPLFAARLISNKITIPTWHFFENYLASFGPEFLFFAGDHNPWHNLINIKFGNLIFLTAILALISLVFLSKKFPQLEKPEQFMIFYLILSPLPSALTVDAPISNRLFHFLLAVLLLAAYGSYQLLNNKDLRLKIFGYFIFIVYFFVFIYFCINYFFLYNKNLANEWYEGVPKLSQELLVRENAYQRIYMSDLPLAYSYFSVYQQFDPKNFQEQAIWDSSGFNEVKEYEQYIFSVFPDVKELSIENIEQFYNANQKEILIVKKVNEVEMLENKARIVFEVKNFEGKTLWVAYELTLDQLISIVGQRIDRLNNQALLDYLLSLKSN